MHLTEEIKEETYYGTQTFWGIQPSCSGQLFILMTIRLLKSVHLLAATPIQSFDAHLTIPKGKYDTAFGSQELKLWV